MSDAESNSPPRVAAADKSVVDDTTNGNGTEERRASRSGDRAGKRRRSRSASRSRSRSPEARRRERSRSPRERSRRRRSTSRERERSRRSRSRDRHDRHDRDRYDDGRRRHDERDRRDRERYDRYDRYDRGGRYNDRFYDRSRRDRYPSPRRDRMSSRVNELERQMRTAFVTNLTPRVTADDLRTFFSQAGRVVNVELVTDRITGRCKGFGFVEFADQGGVDAASALSGQMVDGIPITVQSSSAEKNVKVTPGLAAALAPVLIGVRRMYIGNLHPLVTEQDVRRLAETIGRVESIMFVTDDTPDMDESMGNYAYVKFATAHDCRRAMEEIGEMKLMNRVIRTGYSSDEGQPHPEIEASCVSALSRIAPNGVALPIALLQKLSAPDPSLLAAAAAAAAPAAVPMATMPVMPMAAAPFAFGAAPMGMTGMMPVPSCNIVLRNMFNPANPDENLEEIREDVLEESLKCGTVYHVHVDAHSPEGRVFLKFATVDGAAAALNKMNGRNFDGRTIAASFVSDAEYLAMFPDLANQQLKPLSLVSGMGSDNEFD